MSGVLARALAALALLFLAGCVSAYERGDNLYRQGDVTGALEVWRAVKPGDGDYERVEPRLRLVEEEFGRLLRRYNKRAQFYEQQDRLAEAVLYYRLALKLEPAQPGVLEHVQELVRALESRVGEERSAVEQALAEGRLTTASRHAGRLEALNPFDPAVQVELRQVRASVGAEVLRSLEYGRQAYTLGDRQGARKAFQHVLDLDPENETALGYLAYVRRFEELEEQQRIPPSPATIPQEDILAEGHYRSAQQAEVDGEPFRAIAEYQATLRIEPKHAGARARLASLRRELAPRVETLYETGKRYFQDEDLHNALKTWRQVLLIDPTHERTLENVERAERILSRLEEIQTGGS